MAKTIGQLTSATTIGNGDLFVIEQSSQTKKIAASVVRGGLVNADVDAAAAIAFSKLAALDSANILVGNGSNVATKVAVTGDVTISNAGVTAIGSAKVLPAMLSQPFTLATSQASTSGTSIDFTGIPSWAKRITVMFSGVSKSGSSNILVQLGDSGGIETSGYTATSCLNFSSGTTTAGNTSGFIVISDGANHSLSGQMIISNVSGNAWVSSGSATSEQSANVTVYFGGSKTLSATIDRVRITTVNGTDTFDAGSINISYEG